VPYAFFNFLSPFFSILFAYLNYRIRRIDKEESELEKVISEEDR
jgi:hypothetical protein